jgi:hypothetical protein
MCIALLLVAVHAAAAAAAAGLEHAHLVQQLYTAAASTHQMAPATPLHCAD